MALASLYDRDYSRPLEGCKSLCHGGGFTPGSIVSPTWELFELVEGVGPGRQASYFNLNVGRVLTASEQYIVLAGRIPMASSSLQIINYLGRGEYA